MENDLTHYDLPDSKKFIRKKRNALKVLRKKKAEEKARQKLETVCMKDQIQLMNGETPVLTTIYNFPLLPTLIRERWDVWVDVFRGILAEHPHDEMLALQLIQERIQQVRQSARESLLDYWQECGISHNGKLLKKSDS